MSGDKCVVGCLRAAVLFWLSSISCLSLAAADHLALIGCYLRAAVFLAAFD